VPYASSADQAECARRHYEKNKAACKERAAAHRVETSRRVREALAVYLATHPCVDCGESDPVVLDFDHRDPATKKFSVKDHRSKSKSLDRVMQEVAKCDIRCANCHRRRTVRQRRQGLFKVA
jgi:hypothetical protein